MIMPVFKNFNLFIYGLAIRAQHDRNLERKNINCTMHIPYLRGENDDSMIDWRGVAAFRFW